MTISPEKQKPKNTHRPFIREQITGANQGCLRGIIIFIGLILLFGAILFVLSRL